MAESNNQPVPTLSSLNHILVMPLKHLFPPFLNKIVTPKTYERWLGRKATAHSRRDRKRGHSASTRSLYKEAIHAAVCKSEGLDTYTGESLDWKLISTYKNEDSKIGRHAYKARFALLPTVDHVDAGATKASFVICGWRTNDAKHDQSLAEFINLCEKVLIHAGYTVKRRA